MDDIIARLERYSTTVPFTGCWLWLGADVSNAGYGRLVINGKRHSICRRFIAKKDWRAVLNWTRSGFQDCRGKVLAAVMLTGVFQ